MMKKWHWIVWIGLLGCAGDEAPEPAMGTQQADAGESLSGDEGGGDTASGLGVSPSEWCEPGASLSLGEEGLFGGCQDPLLTVVACGGRVNQLAIGTGGLPGQGLDVDGDPETCAPKGNCEDGIDNQLSIISTLAQEGVEEALASGTLMLFLEYVEPTGGPGVFTMKMHVARIDPTDEECDWQSEVCRYRIRQDSYDDACTAPVVFNDVTVDESGSFHAGGPENEISLNIPLFGVSVSLPVRAARLQGTIVWGPDGLVSSMEGLLVGGIAKQALVGAIDGIPADEFEAGTSLDKETILSAMEGIIVNDLDLDGDGELESASFGARVGAIPGIFTGWESE